MLRICKLQGKKIAFLASRFPSLCVLSMKMELKQFKIAVLPLRSKLLNYARRLTDDPDDAEDVVQETMLKLWKLRNELQQYRSIEAFAMTMVHNQCMDLRRSKRIDEYVSLDYVQDVGHETSPERLLEIKDEIELMRAIIRSLPPLQQTIIQMKDIEEYETDEIAEITGCSPEAIRSNLSRARKKVRDTYLQTIQAKKRRNEQ